MIKFSKPSITKLEEEYVLDSLRNGILSGDGKYTKRVKQQFKDRFGMENFLLTTSGTDALELAALLCDLKPGDEVITPSYTFSSTANAFMIYGAKPVFCDIRPDTFNMDETLIEGLITDKTKAIFTVDYAGVPCEMDVINDIAKRHNLIVVEDAAQAVGSTYKGKPAGTLSEIGCFSFHETKNFAMGEGGATILNDPSLLSRAEILREKGTDRSNLVRGIVDKYTWHDIGSSFLPSDMLAALLSAQMDRYDEIFTNRMNVWNTYHDAFLELEEQGIIRRPHIPENVEHNAHIYYVVLDSEETRTRVMQELRDAGIAAYFHYIPLHSAPFGIANGYTADMLPVTEAEAAKLLRLPLYADMTEKDIQFVISKFKEAIAK